MGYFASGEYSRRQQVAFVNNILNTGGTTLLFAPNSAAAGVHVGQQSRLHPFIAHA